MNSIKPTLAALYLASRLSLAHAQRGEDSLADYGDAFGAASIFLIIAIYAAFKQSKKRGFQTLIAIAVLGVVWIISPAVGGILVGVLGLMFGVALFWSYL